MNKNTMMVVAIVLIVLAGVGGFVGGIQYQKTNAGAGSQGTNGTFRQRFGMMGQNGQNFRPERGQVISFSNGTMTLKLSDGSTKLIVLPSNTNYLKTDTASQSDIKTGDTVTVLGTQNSDGSVTAQDVQVGVTNLQRGMMQRGQPSQSPATGAGY